MQRNICVILYEDSYSGGGKLVASFGLHELVVACVCDTMGVEPSESWLVRRALADCRPMGGNHKLLVACQKVIARDSRPVIAVFDDDKIRVALGLPPDAREEKVRQAILRQVEDPARLSIVLLHRNMESVLKAAQECDPGLDRGLAEKAVRGKKPLVRDELLERLATTHSRPTRDCVLGRVPSLRALVELLCEKVQPARKGAKTRPSRKPSSSRRAWLTRSATRSPRSRPRA